MPPRAELGRLAVHVAIGVVMAGGAACLPPLGDSAGACSIEQPVTNWAVAPPFVAAWWYVGQEPVDYGASSTVGQPVEEETSDDGTSGETVDDPPPPEPEPLPQGDGEPPPDSAGGDTSTPQSLKPAHFVGTSCFTCQITCTTKSPGPGQPRALSTTSGASSTSQAAACADAESRLKHYAGTSYSLDLETCGWFPTTPLDGR
jgi:hypothetical protein